MKDVSGKEISMEIGTVIRSYRKEKQMTQEQLATCLGVTPPAVNKWENGNSLPDISLVAPIARLLGISTDRLLSYKEELTDEEVNRKIEEIRERLKKEEYDTVFQWAKKQMQEYPNSEHLILWMTQMLDNCRETMEDSDAERYDEEIHDFYVRILASEDEVNRTVAAEALFYFSLKRERYEQAEEYLNWYSKQNPERKRKQALLYSKQNRTEEAYRLYEELLFAGYQNISQTLNGIYIAAMQEKNVDKAGRLIKKQEELAKLFEMGRYYEVASRLDLAEACQDKATTIGIKKELLESVSDIFAFTRSELYEHMEFKEVREEFIEEIRENLKTSFEEEMKSELQG